METTREVLLAILAEVTEIRLYLTSQAKENPSPTLAGWVENPAMDRARERNPSQPARASVVDFCKRIEFCFKEHDREFVDFRKTSELVDYILREHGHECLRQFVTFCEVQYESRGMRPIGRPERMENVFHKWLANTGRIG